MNSISEYVDSDALPLVGLLRSAMPRFSQNPYPLSRDSYQAFDRRTCVRVEHTFP
jgi:hypothetical protein